MSSKTGQGTALVTGASSGIGAVYAERLADRGYDLVLVARRRTELETLAVRIAGRTGRKVDVIVADLAQSEGQAVVERRLREDATITLLINNAGAAAGSARGRRCGSDRNHAGDKHRRAHAPVGCCRQRLRWPEDRDDHQYFFGNGAHHVGPGRRIQRFQGLCAELHARARRRACSAWRARAGGASGLHAHAVPPRRAAWLPSRQRRSCLWKNSSTPRSPGSTRARRSPFPRCPTRPIGTRSKPLASR